MLTILTLLLTFSAAFCWQTQPGAQAQMWLYVLISVLTGAMIYRKQREFGRLTFWFVPALLIIVMAVSGSRAAPPHRWGEAPGTVWGYQLYWLAQDAATARYLAVAWFATIYVLISLCYTSRRAAKELVLAGVVIYAVTIIQVIAGIDPRSMILQQPSYAATLCALLLPVSAVLEKQRRDCYVLGGIVAVLLYRAETGYALMVIYLAFWAMERRGIKLEYRYYLPALFGIGAVVGILAMFFTPTTALDRIMFWRGAISDFLAHPILGVGPGRFYHYGLGHHWPGYFAHSLPLTFLSEVGIIGMLVLALFVAMVWGTRRKRPAYANQVLLMAAVASLWDDAWLMWAISLVIAVALATTLPDEDTVPEFTEVLIRTQSAQSYYTNKAKNLIWRLITCKL